MRAPVLFCLAAGYIECSVTVQNTGTTRINTLTLTAPSNVCTMGAVLAPGSNYTCTVRKAVNQSNFDAQEGSTVASLSLPVTAAGTTGVAGGLTYLPNAVSTFTGLMLPVLRNMTASSKLSKAYVNSTGMQSHAWHFIRCDTASALLCLASVVASTHYVALCTWNLRVLTILMFIAVQA